MVLALVGIIWVQWYWINNGLKIKEKQFDQLVNTSLNDIIRTLEDKESVTFLSKKINTFTSDIVIDTDTNSNGFVWASSYNDSINVIELGEDSEDVTVRVETISENTNGKTQQVKTHKKVIVNNKVVTDNVDIKTEEILGDRFDNIIIRMVKEFKRRDNPLENFIGKTNLDSLTEKKLVENGIKTPFTFGVIESDSIIKKYSSNNYQLTNNNYQIPLFKHDLSSKPTLLSVSFENKRIAALKSMWGMVLISIVFTLFIILCFSGALYYMFKQKKVAEIKNDFINNMTHEFKTPISTISLAIDSITHPKIIDDKNQINYYADIIRKENKRMNLQVESVLNTSLAEKNELTLEKKDVSINELLEKVKTRMELQLNNANAIYTVNNNCKIETINLDENHFQNVLCNLIDNAIKYAINKPEITLSVNTIVNQSIAFTLYDNGIGMSKDTQKKVFDKFYRVQTGNIHNIKGFGIGLSYVKAIVEAHNGEITVDSKLNKGTKITIIIHQNK